MSDLATIDLHMHSTVSDGTQTPDEILQSVRDAGLTTFSLTDHDAVKGCQVISGLLTDQDPAFIRGVEFSCKDGNGRYHILGYGYDPDSVAIQKVIMTGHRYRMNKVNARLDFLKKEFGFDFPEEELYKLFHLDNPGKPHVANLMVKYGFAATKDDAIRHYINRIHFGSEYVTPREAIEGITEAGGIPVLAHPSYGSGDQIVTGDEMDARLKRLIGFGLRGVEAFYSGFTKKLRDEMLRFSEKYDLYVTAGSDYHGANKMVILADTGLDEVDAYPAAMERFLADVSIVS